MKSITALLAFCVPFLVQAQDWAPVKLGMVHTFAMGNEGFQYRIKFEPGLNGATPTRVMGSPIPYSHAPFNRCTNGMEVVFEPQKENLLGLRMRLFSTYSTLTYHFIDSAGYLDTNEIYLRHGNPVGSEYDFNTRSDVSFLPGRVKVLYKRVQQVFGVQDSVVAFGDANGGHRFVLSKSFGLLRGLNLRAFYWFNGTQRDSISATAPPDVPVNRPHIYEYQYWNMQPGDSLAFATSNRTMMDLRWLTSEYTYMRLVARSYDTSLQRLCLTWDMTIRTIGNQVFRDTLRQVLNLSQLPDPSAVSGIAFRPIDSGASRSTMANASSVAVLSADSSIFQNGRAVVISEGYQNDSCGSGHLGFWATDQSGFEDIIVPGIGILKSESIWERHEAFCWRNAHTGQYRRCPQVVGLKPLVPESIPIHPNPAHTTARLLHPIQLGTLYNSAGRIVNNINGQEINVRGLPRGIYQLRGLTQTGQPVQARLVME